MESDFLDEQAPTTAAGESVNVQLTDAHFVPQDTVYRVDVEFFDTPQTFWMTEGFARGWHKATGKWFLGINPDEIKKEVKDGE